MRTVPTPGSRRVVVLRELRPVDFVLVLSILTMLGGTLGIVFWLRYHGPEHAPPDDEGLAPPLIIRRCLSQLLAAQQLG